MTIHLAHRPRLSSVLQLLFSSSIFNSSCKYIFEGGKQETGTSALRCLLPLQFSNVHCYACSLLPSVELNHFLFTASSHLPACAVLLCHLPSLSLYPFLPCLFQMSLNACLCSDLCFYIFTSLPFLFP